MHDTTTQRPKAYSYLRFSTAEQGRGDSYRRQLELAENYCRQKGLDLDRTTTFEDLGVSAFSGKNRRNGLLPVSWTLS
ncbi:MAG: recombinase family protein [Bosea sp. (in: a-proteobacteria)]|uniref:recombinase family protein n=1 Tax=Bosea sp. (in: a-proteobacteria) TaxID=1871050 RepID=UPI003F7C22AA